MRRLSKLTLVLTWASAALYLSADSPGETHWAFRPVVRSAPPGVREPVGIRNPIDRFLRARLEREGLQPQDEAERGVLIRRVYFSLIGLPPTPEEVEAFENDRDPLAYEKLVERLLASPHFGERWARHWLDVVRFAESDGFEMNQARTSAWPYREYVIRAFNEDRPYDRFVREQLAGDVLGEDAATGFLVAGPVDKVKSPDPVLTAQQRADEMHDMIATVGSTFLGLTIGCARCHAHKFDPIPQTDYYALAALLAGVQHGERPVRSAAAPLVSDDTLAATPGSMPARLRPPVQTGRNVDRFGPVEAKFVRFTIRATSGAEPCLDELEIFTAEPAPRNVALAPAGAKVQASSSLPGYAIHRLEHLHDGKYGNDHSWISNEAGKGWVQIELAKPERIERVVWSRDRTEPPRYRDRLATSYVIEVSNDGATWQPVAGSHDRAATTATAYVGRMTAPGSVHRLHRGDVTQPRELAMPGLLSALGPARAVSAASSDAQRRQALAEWIVDPRHPLTARVMVNRLWHYHFGTGLVDTPSDFGKNGSRPTHPELLDWLACELMESGWSLKHIHRLIVTTAAFCRDSAASAAGLARDAQSRLLWRFPPRRLEAEALRDAILAVSGKLDRRMGGPGFDLFEPNTNYVKVYTPRRDFGPETFRRMVYQAKPRMQLDDTFGAFDCPDAGQIAPRRGRSITPLQALNLLNSPFLMQQSEYFAERLREEPAPVRRAFLLAFGRPPSAEEEAAGERLARAHGLAMLCRALFNANEFVFLR